MTQLALLPGFSSNEWEQLSLFSSPDCDAPSDAHETTIIDGQVRVRLRVSSATITTPIPTGPLTRGECEEWEECALYACRYHLPRGATLNGVPQHCALNLADGGELNDASIAELMGRFAIYEADGALKRLQLQNLYIMDDVEGRQVNRGVVEVEEDVTSAEARRLLVPGEEKKGRQALTVMHKRWKKKDPWVGVLRRIPEQWAEKVDVRLMEPLRANDNIPARFSDMKEMLKNRKREAA